MHGSGTRVPIHLSRLLRSGARSAGARSESASGGLGESGRAGRREQCTVVTTDARARGMASLPLTVLVGRNPSMAAPFLNPQGCPDKGGIEISFLPKKEASIE